MYVLLHDWYKSDFFGLFSDDDTGGVFSQDLMSAVLNGHLDDARKLIEEGADVNAEDVHGNTVRVTCIERGFVNQNSCKLQPIDDRNSQACY